MILRGSLLVIAAGLLVLLLDRIRTVRPPTLSDFEMGFFSEAPRPKMDVRDEFESLVSILSFFAQSPTGRKRRLPRMIVKHRFCFYWHYLLGAIEKFLGGPGYGPRSRLLDELDGLRAEGGRLLQAMTPSDIEALRERLKIIS